MHDVKVLEGRERRVGRQGPVDEELDLAAAGAQTIARVDAELLAHAFDHTADLALEVLRVVDHVEVGMAYPRRGGLVVEVASQLDALGAARVVLRRVELLGAVGRRHHVDYLVVTIVPQLDVVPTVGGHHQLPLILRYNCEKHKTLG